MTAPGALARLVKGQPRGDSVDEERCELCRVPVDPGHRHVVDLHDGHLGCACTPCSLLFDGDGAARGRYRLVPDRYVRLADDAVLGDLDVPVGLAFFVKSSGEARVVAHYPSPAGATRWDLDIGVWPTLESRYPVLRDLRPDVEALLVNTARGARERWVVPLDACYRLVALIRKEWRGLSGGTGVWSEIERFFTSLPGKGLR